MAVVKTHDGVVISADDLTTFSASIFAAAGLSARYAEAQAEMLVWANLRGIDSHGVLRIPWYVGLIDSGDIVPDAVPRTTSETPATAMIDAGGAPGPIATLAGVEAAIAKARAVGAAWVVVRDLTHNGALAYYSERIAAAGLIGITTVTSPPNMAPFGAKAPGLHNSPISVGVPAANHPPILLDMATSIAAGGKINLAADRDVAIPQGWALDRAGNATTDPKAAKILLPFEGPKGSGLSMMFECWSSLLANLDLSAPDHRQRQNAMVAAIDVAAFLDPDTYRAQVDALIERIHGLPRAGDGPVLVPGERERGVCEERLRDGIPLPNGTIERIDGVADRFGATPPWRQASSALTSAAPGRRA